MLSEPKLSLMWLSLQGEARTLNAATTASRFGTSALKLASLGPVSCTSVPMNSAHGTVTMAGFLWARYKHPIRTGSHSTTYPVYQVRKRGEHDQHEV